MATTLKHDGMKVTKGHETTLKSGEKVAMEWEFDFTGVDAARIREWATETLVIRTRQKTGLKDLSKAEATEKFGHLSVRVSDIGKLERVKHTETPEEKQMRELIAALVAKGKTIAEIRAAMTEDDEMDLGESVA